jgi:hypothetical protein
MGTEIGCSLDNGTFVQVNECGDLGGCIADIERCPYGETACCGNDVPASLPANDCSGRTLKCAGSSGTTIGCDVSQPDGTTMFVEVNECGDLGPGTCVADMSMCPNGAAVCCGSDINQSTQLDCEASPGVQMFFCDGTSVSCAFMSNPDVFDYDCAEWGGCVTDHCPDGRAACCLSEQVMTAPGPSPSPSPGASPSPSPSMTPTDCSTLSKYCGGDNGTTLGCDIPQPDGSTVFMEVEECGDIGDGTCITDAEQCPGGVDACCQGDIGQ